MADDSENELEHRDKFSLSKNNSRSGEGERQRERERVYGEGNMNVQSRYKLKFGKSLTAAGDDGSSFLFNLCFLQTQQNSDGEEKLFVEFHRV